MTFVSFNPNSQNQNSAEGISKVSERIIASIEKEYLCIS